MCFEPAEGTESLKQSTGQTGQMVVRVKTDPHGPELNGSKMLHRGTLQEILQSLQEATELNTEVRDCAENPANPQTTSVFFP